MIFYFIFQFCQIGGKYSFVFHGLSFSPPRPFQAEMSTWMRVINAAAASALTPQDPAEDQPALINKGMTRAMTMPAGPPHSASEGTVTLRSKEAKEKDREKRFSFFKKNK